MFAKSVRIHQRALYLAISLFSGTCIALIYFGKVELGEDEPTRIAKNREVKFKGIKLTLGGDSILLLKQRVALKSGILAVPDCVRSDQGSASSANWGRGGKHHVQ
jgi:hypothetical protein